MSEVIRLARAQDAEALHAIFAPVVRSSAVSFEKNPPSVAQMRARIERGSAYPWLISQHDDLIAAYAYARPHRSGSAWHWTAQTSIYVHPTVRGTGVGTRVSKTLLQMLSALGYRTAMARITLPNDPSVSLHEGLGYEFVGRVTAAGFKLGSWHDVGWWQAIIGDVSGEPAPARTVAELSDSELGKLLAQ